MPDKLSRATYGRDSWTVVDAMGYKQVKTVAAVFQWHMLLKTDLREDKHIFLLNPSGASDLKYSPSYPSNFHMPMCYTNCFKSEGYFCIHLVLHLTFTFTFTFTHTCYLLPSLSAVLMFPSPSSPLSHSFSHSSLFSFSHLSTMSLFCAHVLRQKKKQSMLECVCCRSGADCTMDEMSL